MSVLGTGVAAGVAQTGLQAQQAARHRDGQAEPAARQLRRVRETIEAHTRGLDEADEAALAGRPPMDEHMPEQGPPPYDGPGGGEEEVKETPQTPGKTSGEKTLYKHLDIKA